MSATLTRQRPAGTGRGCRNSIEYGKPTTSSRLPHDWRERLSRLDPMAYYTCRVGKLTGPNAAGWASAKCPFHEDRTASLGINSRHGGWHCHAGCGSGDLIGFHQRRTGAPFVEAVRDLLRGGA